MSFTDAMKQLFGGAPAQVQQPMSPQQAANLTATGLNPTGVANPGAPLPGTAASSTMDNNGLVPVQINPTSIGDPGNSDASPLAAFDKIWETPPTDPNANKPIFAGLDANKLMEQASRIDFSKAVTPEMMAKINAGGEGAMQALVEAMSKVGQTVYAQSAFATTKIVEKALTEQQSRNDAALPNMVKKFSVNENLVADNPILNSPAVAPLVDALRTTLIQKNPNASTAEIQAQIVDYFAAMGKAFTITPTAPKKKVAAGEDWDKFFV